MKVIDICDNYAGAGCLKRYYQENNINDFKIIAMGLNLAIGDIKEDHLSFMRKIYKDSNYDYNESINDLLSSINDEITIRVWSSKRNADDYLLLLYVCNLLKNKCNDIYVVYTTDYNEKTLSINAMDYKEVDMLLENEKKLSIDEIYDFSNKWNELVQINSELRVLENGVIVNKKYSDYDDVILNTLNELGQCKIVGLVGKLIANHIINDFERTAYFFLIDRLIDSNKIKIISKGEKHFTDIIEKR